MKRRDIAFCTEDPHVWHHEKEPASAMSRRAFPSHGKMILLATVFVSALSALATLNTRTDIDPSGFPVEWDVSNRTTYQVDVASTTFETLETASISVVALTFDLNSFDSGLVVRFR